MNVECLHITVSLASVFSSSTFATITEPWSVEWGWRIARLWTFPSTFISYSEYDALSSSLLQNQVKVTSAWLTSHWKVIFSSSLQDLSSKGEVKNGSDSTSKCSLLFLKKVLISYCACSSCQHLLRLFISIWLLSADDCSLLQHSDILVRLLNIGIVSRFSNLISNWLPMAWWPSSLRFWCQFLGHLWCDPH